MIEAMGADGDGIGRLADGAAVYVPFTLPSETVALGPVVPRGTGWAADVVAIQTVSEERVTAPCPHFAACGGCTLQHWGAGGYGAWKAGLLTAALERAGFPQPAVAPLVAGMPGTRRRMDLAGRRGTDGMRLGLHRGRSAEIVDLDSCLVLAPALAGLIGPLRALLARLGAVRRDVSAIANLLDSGPDLLLRGDGEPSLADRARMTEFATTHGLCRMSWARGTEEPEPVCVIRPPEVTLSGIAVAPPPGAFLQATAGGEAAIVAAVLAGLPSKLPARTRIAEYHAGCGTLTFALAQHARVTAWEGDPAAAAALDKAVRAGGLGGRVAAIRRDLARQPPQGADLAGHAVAVLDPPHGGAAEAMGGLAAARVPTVIYVSCNPVALARDARVLAQAGYTLVSAVSIDQFLFSARLESVSVFRLERR